MDWVWGFLSGIASLAVAIFTYFKYIRYRPKVNVEAKVEFEEAGGTGSADDTFWRLWKDVYITICIANTRGPATVKTAFISMNKNGSEVLRFHPYKTIQYIDFKKPYKSPQLEKNLAGSRIDTNDSWGPHVVVFTAIRGGKKEEITLSDCESFLIIEVVGQKLKSLPVKVFSFP